MALKSKTNEEPVVEQISFDDLEFDAEYVDEEEMSVKKYYTISGKESQYEPEWEKMKASELDIDDEFDGRPEINKFNTVNLETFAKYVDSMERVWVKITEGNTDSDYNSWMITRME